MAYPVKLHVYDLTQGMARAMSMPMVGVQVDLVPHSGIAVYGYEFFFSGGIQAERGGWTGLPRCETLDLGTTEVPFELFLEFLKERADEFTMATYNLRSWNCNNFSDECAQFLLGCSIPRRIVGFAEDVLALPQLAGFAMMVENMGNPAANFAAQGMAEATEHTALRLTAPAVAADPPPAPAATPARLAAPAATPAPPKGRTAPAAAPTPATIAATPATSVPHHHPPSGGGALTADAPRRTTPAVPLFTPAVAPPAAAPTPAAAAANFSTPAFVTPAAGGRRQVAPNDVAPLLAVGGETAAVAKAVVAAAKKASENLVTSQLEAAALADALAAPDALDGARAATLGAALASLLRAVPTASQFAPLYACRILAAASAEFVAAFLGGGASATLLAGALAHGAPRSVRLMALTTLGNAAGGAGCREFLVEAPAPELAKLLGAALVAAGEAADAQLSLTAAAAVHNIALRLPADGAAEEVDVAVAAGLLRGMLLKDLHMVRDASLSAEVVRRLLLALGFVLHGASSGTREAARGAGGHGTEEALAAAAARAAEDARIGAIVDEVRALLV